MKEDKRAQGGFLDASQVYLFGRYTAENDREQYLPLPEGRPIPVFATRDEQLSDQVSA